MASLTPRQALKDVNALGGSLANVVGNGGSGAEAGPTKRNDQSASQAPIHVKNEAWGENVPGPDSGSVDRRYEGKYTAPEEEGGGGEGTVASDPTFITGVPSAPTPVSGMGKIEERLNAVNDEQAKMRAELEAYVKEVRGRTDEAGDKLVDFPDSFDSDAEKEAKREAGWRKFISTQVLEHPNEEEERKMKKKLELGLGRIQELDMELEKAEMKYLESKSKLKGSEGGGEDEDEDGEVAEPVRRRTKPAPVSPSENDGTSPSRVDAVNKRSAQMGRQVLLTEEEEDRVNDIMADMMDEIRQEAHAELYGQKTGEAPDGKPTSARVPDAPNAYCPEEGESEVLVDLETKLVEHQDLREHTAPTGLVFDERRGTYILVDPADVNKEKSKREPTLKSNDVLASMRRERIVKQKLEQIDSALEALKDAPVHLIESTATPAAKNGRGKTNGKKKTGDHSPSRRPTSLRAFLKPVSPSRIHTAVEEARREVVDMADQESIGELVAQVKEAVIVATDPPETTPREESRQESKSSTPSPPAKRKTARKKMKKSASIAAAERSSGVRHIEVNSSATSLHGDDSTSPKKSVFGWDRTTTERYIPGSKKPIVKKSPPKGRKASPEPRYSKK
jgi:hypothetical protein